MPAPKHDAKAGTVFERAMAILDGAETLPELVVLDLDYTIWPCYCECCGRTPPELYPHVQGIIAALHARGVRMAIASRSPATAAAKAFLASHGLSHFFEAVAIYPSASCNKERHFRELKQATGVQLSRMLFYDDEDGNIRSAEQQGTTCVLVDDGVTLDTLHQGLESYNVNLMQSKGL